MNNPVWLMSSAWPGKSLSQLIDAALRTGAQGLELCVFRRDGSRQDHVATHVDYEQFNSAEAVSLLNLFNLNKLHFHLGAYENLIGGDEGERLLNQNHLLRLIRMAALLGGNGNGIHVGTFVGYNHSFSHEEFGFERNLLEYEKVFAPIIRYAEDLDVTVLYENCPMEGWRSAGYSNTYNNLPATLAARKLMYALIPSQAHGEIYDPSHDIWQHVDPVDVLNHCDFSRIRSVHLKTTRMLHDSSSVHWGGVYGKQAVSAELAAKADIPVAEHEWDRFAYEPMVPGFGGSDSMDWRNFIQNLMDKGYSGHFSIENEGVNSKGTGDDAAIEQGFRACISYIMPMIWPLQHDKGYLRDISEDRKLGIPAARSLPLVSMNELKR